MNRSFWVPLLAVATMFVARPASATVVEKLTVEDMARRAHRVVRGVVRRQTTAWSEGRARILTYTEIDVLRNLKGAAEPVVVVTPGGTLDGLSDWPQGTPKLEVGEEVVLFLEQNAELRGFVHLGMASTVFHVDRRSRAVTRNLAGIGFVTLSPDRPMGPIENPGATVEQFGAVDRFENRILHALGQGALRPR